MPSVVGSVFSVDELLGHLLECAAGFCAVLQKTRPNELAHFEKLRARADEEHEKARAAYRSAGGERLLGI